MVKGKSPSSSRWLQRQLKDPLVKQSKADNYRARSAYKLIEMDGKYHFLRKKSIIVDLGACPGAWSQVASHRIGTDHLSNKELVTWNHGMVLAIDKEVMRRLPGVYVIDKADITVPDTLQRIAEFLSERRVDVVMSDMAPGASGIHSLDHERIMELAVSAYQISQKYLKSGGTFLCKVWQGSLLSGFKTELKVNFKSVQEIRCQSSRKESSEAYLLAQQCTQN